MGRFRFALDERPANPDGTKTTRPTTVASAADRTFPALSGRVVDSANILSANERAVLESKLGALESQSGIQLVVASVTSLGGREIEPFAHALFRAWKLGDAKKNNGVLFLIAPNEHRVRIEVGYGIEGTLTDAASKIITANAVTPRFKAGDFNGGVDHGVDDIIAVLTPNATPLLTTHAADRQEPRYVPAIHATRELTTWMGTSQCLTWRFGSFPSPGSWGSFCGSRCAWGAHHRAGKARRAGETCRTASCFTVAAARRAAAARRTAGRFPVAAAHRAVVARRTVGDARIGVAPGGCFGGLCGDRLWPSQRLCGAGRGGLSALWPGDKPKAINGALRGRDSSRADCACNGALEARRRGHGSVARCAIVDRLLCGLVHLLGRHQHDRLRCRRVALIYGPARARRGAIATF